MRSSFFLGRLSSWVKIRLHTENQLPRLSGSALKVPGWGGGWVPSHYHVKLQLMLSLSWAVTMTQDLPHIGIVIQTLIFSTVDSLDIENKNNSKIPK